MSDNRGEPDIWANLSNESVDQAEGDAKELEFLRTLRLMATDHYAKPDFTLEQDGVGFAPLGNIMAICAEMKSGKTWLMLQLAATLLAKNNPFGGVIRRTEDCAPARVLWFDTEQDKYDTMLILKRLHQLCGWSYDVDHDEFQIYNLRSVKFDERKAAILNAIRLIKPTMVFVDGIRDLVQSVNEEGECYELINEFMTITEQLHCSIWSVLHVNPNSDKMRGHLGTELGNKTTDVFSVKKRKDADGQITFDVEQVAARHRDVAGWSFRIYDPMPNSRTYSVPVMLTMTESNEQKVERADELREILSKYFPPIAAISFTKLRDLVKNGERMGTGKVEKMIKEAQRLGLIETVIGGKLRMSQKPKDGDGKATQTECPF